MSKYSYTVLRKRCFYAKNTQREKASKIEKKKQEKKMKHTSTRFQCEWFYSFPFFLFMALCVFFSSLLILNIW